MHSEDHVIQTCMTLFKPNLKCAAINGIFDQFILFNASYVQIIEGSMAVGFRIHFHCEQVEISSKYF